MSLKGIRSNIESSLCGKTCRFKNSKVKDRKMFFNQHLTGLGVNYPCPMKTGISREIIQQRYLKNLDNH